MNKKAQMKLIVWILLTIFVATIIIIAVYQQFGSVGTKPTEVSESFIDNLLGTDEEAPTEENSNSESIDQNGG
jgi:hypothetical protein